MFGTASKLSTPVKSTTSKSTQAKILDQLVSVKPPVNPAISTTKAITNVLDKPKVEYASSKTLVWLFKWIQVPGTRPVSWPIGSEGHENCSPVGEY
ncbi:hypothetical protein RSAG8_13454, partial [Rhizoctonia solani AG-8 WAC10335]